MDGAWGSVSTLTRRLQIIRFDTLYEERFRATLFLRIEALFCGIGNIRNTSSQRDEQGVSLATLETFGVPTKPQLNLPSVEKLLKIALRDV